jgi:hypothetical protein
MGFEHRAEAERFLQEWKDRLHKFGLELHPDKTRLIEFGRHAAEKRKQLGEGKSGDIRFSGLHAHLWEDPEDRPVHRQAPDDPQATLGQAERAEGGASATLAPASGRGREVVEVGRARLARKSGGHESKLAYCGNVLIENRNGLVVDTELVLCSGSAERDAALEMAGRIAGEQRVTVGSDKGYDTRGFVREMRYRNVTPHVSQNTNRPGGSAIDGRTIRHAGYQVSQRKRKRIEEVFGWLKTVAMLRKTRHRGVFKVGWVFTFAAAAYNLVRMRNLAVVPSA